jgi:hypothetical protein
MVVGLVVVPLVIAIGAAAYLGFERVARPRSR